MKTITTYELKALYETKSLIQQACDFACQQKTGMSLLDFEVFIQEKKEIVETAIFGLSQANCYALFFKVFQQRKDLSIQQSKNALLLEEQQKLQVINKQYSLEMKTAKTNKKSTLNELDVVLDSYNMSRDEVLKMLNMDKNDLLSILTLQSKFISEDVSLSKLELEKENNEVAIIHKQNIDTIQSFYKICNGLFSVMQKALYSRMIHLKKMEGLDKSPAGKAVRTQFENRVKEAFEIADVKTQAELMAFITNLMIFKAGA